MLYFRFIADYLKGYLGWVLTLLILLILESICYSSIGFSFKYIIDNVLITKNVNLMIMVFIALAINGVVISGLGITRDYFEAHLYSNVLGDISRRLFRQLQKLSMNYYSNTQSGEILLHFSNELSGIERTTSATIGSAIGPFITLCTNFVMLVILDWKLSLVVLLALPFIVFGPKKMSAKISQAGFDVQEKEATLLSLISENIITQLIVRTFGLNNYFNQTFEKLIQNLTKKRIMLEFFSAISYRIAESVAVYLQIIVLCMGAYLVYKNQLSIGSLIAFQTLFTSLIYTVAFMTQYFPILKTGESSVRRIQDFLLLEPAIKNNLTPVSVDEFKHSIVFNDVFFRYRKEDSTDNLKNISCTLRQGDTVAFVGESGSGKSTIFSLLLRIYDPNSGSITLDGTDLRHFSQDSLHLLMGFVSQDSLLFNLSIRENIRLGNLDATDEEIESAAKAAEIHDFIVSKADGYDTLLKERGSNLSGGQKQRIAIARAIVRKPSILLLDEATSALDPVSASSIHKTLIKLTQNRTTIIVTHSLADSMKSNRIFVLHQGKIIEEGNHEELLSLSGYYKKLWDKQHGFTIDAENNIKSITPERLQKIPIFEGVSIDLLEKITGLFSILSRPANHVIFSQGDTGDVFYILVRGTVGVYKRDPATPVAILQDGDHFGEIALMQNIQRTATIKTITNCTFLILTQEDFMKLMDKLPKVEKNVIKIATERIKNDTSNPY